jgi:hypothetical protein
MSPLKLICPNGDKVHWYVLGNYTSSFRHFGVENSIPEANEKANQFIQKISGISPQLGGSV